MYPPYTKLLWPAMQVPAYKECVVGSWELEHVTQVFQVPGYFTRHHHTVTDCWRLMQSRQTWMSLTPFELESQAHHAAEAYGHVVVAGLGMGMLLYNLCRSKRIRRITVLESDSDVLAIMNESCDISSWTTYTGRAVEFVICDALKWRPQISDSDDDKVQTLLADIWPNFADENLRDDLLAMQDNIGATLVGAWGQEGDFLHWLGSTGRRPPVTMRDWKDYQAELGFRLVGGSNKNYPLAAQTAVWRQIEFSWMNQANRLIEVLGGNVSIENTVTAK